MARVSQEHLDARRRQILHGAARCFARNGFHATSVQDVLQETGLSNGAMYRYFRSKGELITAIAEEVFSIVRTTFEDLTCTDPLPPLDEVLRRVLHDVHDSPLAKAHPDRRGHAQLVVQVWVETLRDPELAALLREANTVVLGSWEQLIRAYQAAGRVPADVHAEQVSRVLFMTIRGAVIQEAMYGDFDVENLIAGMHGIASLMAWEKNTTPSVP
ncbi:TetR/AcrR family transcriptional regulator [Streptomyces clavifer]|uniref:TetR/AcrR family transcriptional regulator n=1 Tax=Streptomyces clavifer TaxID=68188 RepID=UPI0038007D5C